jgi:hypothetical protein
MASQAFGGPYEGLDLGRREVFPAPPMGIGLLARWQDAVGGGWGRGKSRARYVLTAWTRGWAMAGHSVLQNDFPEKKAETVHNRTV